MPIASDLGLSLTNQLAAASTIVKWLTVTRYVISSYPNLQSTSVHSVIAREGTCVDEFPRCDSGDISNCHHRCSTCGASSLPPPMVTRTGMDLGFDSRRDWSVAGSFRCKSMELVCFLLAVITVSFLFLAQIFNEQGHLLDQA